MRNKKGISLIVLVITIIVMIILAAAVIISLSNSGIINRANEAVNKTNITEVQHLASLAWSETYLDVFDDKTLTEDQKQTKIQEAVEKALTDNDLNPEDYDLTYGAGGVTVTAKGQAETAKWELKRTTNEDGLVTKVVVTNGTDTYDVGTVVNYMPEGVGPENAKYTGSWKILGVDESGRLLIMSTSSITGSNILLGGSSLEVAKTSYINALDTLQNTVKDYKDGIIGVSVRSITVEDVNAVTGYDPTTYTTSFMGVSEVKPYNIEVAYSWNSGGVEYSWSKGSGNLDDSHSGGFTYYDEMTNTFVTKVKATSGDITTLKNTEYSYTGKNSLSETTAAYKMLFRNVTDTSNVTYWLASRYTYLYTFCANFGIRYVNNGDVIGAFLVESYTDAYSNKELEVRAVVTLASNIRLTESTTTAGTYDLGK